MADNLLEPPNKRAKLTENAVPDNSDFTFGKLWDLENELPEELMVGTPGLEASDLPQQQPNNQTNNTQQNLLNGTGESISGENNASTQRHQQLSQLLQTKPPASHSTVPTSQRIPSPNVSLANITGVKSPHANNMTPPNATVNKTGTPVSSTVQHINATDGSIAITNISNSMINSLNNTSGTMGMNNNMLLMQSKASQNVVSLSTSVANTIQHQAPLTVVQPTVNQPTASLINGNHMALANTNSLNITRGVNPNVSSAMTHSTVMAPNSPHQNILGHLSLNNQGANIKNPGAAQLGQANNSPFHVYNAVSAPQIGHPTSISSISVRQSQAITSIAMSMPPRYSTPVDSNLANSISREKRYRFTGAHRMNILERQRTETVADIL
ncbi:CREB-binding protein-like [Uloborus diversus]|uniref:CREB-binding protein-like n=1 Tax=Uloborus diversus TaxID=327109 RepID=UPI00240A4D08|nr:CREB-binding protein-like [Uloborus diversus]